MSQTKTERKIGSNPVLNERFREHLIERYSISNYFDQTTALQALAPSVTYNLPVWMVRCMGGRSADCMPHAGSHLIL